MVMEKYWQKSIWEKLLVKIYLTFLFQFGYNFFLLYFMYGKINILICTARFVFFFIPSARAELGNTFSIALA